MSSKKAGSNVSPEDLAVKLDVVLLRLYLMAVGELDRVADEQVLQHVYACLQLCFASMLSRPWVLLAGRELLYGNSTSGGMPEAPVAAACEHVASTLGVLSTSDFLCDEQLMSRYETALQEVLWVHVRAMFNSLTDVTKKSMPLCQAALEAGMLRQLFVPEHVAVACQLLHDTRAIVDVAPGIVDDATAAVDGTSTAMDGTA